MPPACTVCTNAKCAAIEAALKEKVPLRTIAMRFHVSRTSLLRHRDRHLTPAPVVPEVVDAPVFPPAPAVPAAPPAPAAPLLTPAERLAALALHQEVTTRLRFMEAFSAEAWPWGDPAQREELLARIREQRAALAAKVGL